MITSMLRHHRKLAILLVPIGLFAAYAGWEASAGARGRLVAHFDVARGHYRLLTFGYPPRWMPEYRRVLRLRYGIETEAVAGCGVTQSIVDYVEGYDGVSVRAARQKFGRDVFGEVEAEVSRSAFVR